MSVQPVTIPLHPVIAMGTVDGPFFPETFRAGSRSPHAPEAFAPGRAIATLFRFTILTPQLTRLETIRLEAWLARIGHRAWCFTAWDPLREFPTGVGNGYSRSSEEILFTPTPAGPAQSLATDFRLLKGASHALVKQQAPRKATTLLVKGFDPALAGQAALKEGDHFSVGQPGEMNLHMVIGDAVIDAQGCARFEFLAPLWKRALPNDVVRLVRPTGRFSLFTEDRGYFAPIRHKGHLSQGRLVAVERPYQEAMQ